MFDAWVSFTPIDDFSARCINQIKDSLNVEIIYNFPLIGTSCWTLSKHSFYTIYHHLGEPFDD